MAYAVSPFLWQGALVAIEITVIGMIVGVVVGFMLALMRLSTNKVLSGVSWFYIWFVRGTPQLLQLVFIFDVLPLAGLKFNSFTTAAIGFALNEAAFSAELLRAGILSVAASQAAAATALGMGRGLTLRRIVMPQAMKTILPGLGNDTISMLKLTSIASVIFVNELTYRSQQIVGHRGDLPYPDQRYLAGSDGPGTAIRPNARPCRRWGDGAAVGAVREASRAPASVGSRGGADARRQRPAGRP
jgi:polar amino acid transport system permease protein